MKAHQIHYAETLDYCDGVQLFAAEDAAGNDYIAALVGVGRKADQYLIVACETEALLTFLAGTADLESLMRQSAKQGWYLADVNDFGEPFPIIPQVGTVIPEKLLPGAGFYLDGSEAG